MLFKFRTFEKTFSVRDCFGAIDHDLLPSVNLWLAQGLCLEWKALLPSASCGPLEKELTGFLSISQHLRIVYKIAQICGGIVFSVVLPASQQGLREEP